MNVFFRAFSASARLIMILCALTLVGCRPQTSPPNSTQQSSQNHLSVQSDAVYRQATEQFSKHDYKDALVGINSLLANSQFASNPADHAFLLHQQAICRHAIDPRVPLDTPAASPPSTIRARAPLTVAQADCGPRALLLLCPSFGIHTNLATLRRQAGTTPKGTTLQGLAHAATVLGLKAKGVQVDKQALAQVSLPAIVWYDGNHYINLLSVSEEQATIRDPNKPKEEDISTNELLGRSGGILLTLSR